MTLHMVELTVAEVARSAAWYRDVCGWSVVTHDERNGFTLLESGGGRLALKHGPTTAGGGVRLHFLVADLTAELARLAALGIHPESALKASPEGYRRAAFRDPDGYAVTLFEWVSTGG